MTIDEFNSLRFNTPLHSNIDNTLWHYDCRTSNGDVKIFKELVDVSRYRVYTPWNGNNDSWVRRGDLTIPSEMLLEDFDLVYGIKKPENDLKLVKLNKTLMEPYSIINPNFHMMEDLPF